MTKTALFALSLIASAMTAAPAVAQTADLDLSTAEGQRKLDHRITRAAYDVCGEASDADLVGKNAVRQCRADTIAAAASQRQQLLAGRSGAPIRVASAR